MSPQAGWILQEEVLPRLRSAVPRAVNCVGCEDAEELVQNAAAIAAKMFHSAEAAGKTFTPGNIAHYAIQHLKSGRRSTDWRNDLNTARERLACRYERRS